jgi:uncharacterized protein
VLWQHQERDVPIGTPLSIVPDAYGLRVRVKLYDHARAREVLAMAKDLLALGRRLSFSIGYRAHDVSWEKVGGRTVRRVKRIDLVEFSATTRPMNPQAVVTSAKGRTMDEMRAEVKAVSDWLAEAERRESEDARGRHARCVEQLEALEDELYGKTEAAARREK